MASDVGPRMCPGMLSMHRRAVGPDGLGRVGGGSGCAGISWACERVDVCSNMLHSQHPRSPISRKPHPFGCGGHAKRNVNIQIMQIRVAGVPSLAQDLVTQAGLQNFAAFPKE